MRFNEPMSEIKSDYGFIYHGDREGWLVAYGYSEAVSTAEQCLDASNMAEMNAQFDAIDPDGDDHATETFGGAFGRGGYLLVRPDTDCERIAIELRERLDDYIALNEDDWSERESDATLETLADWARTEYPDVDAETLASCMYFAAANVGRVEYLDAWPNRDSAYDRPIIAAALREARKQSRMAA